MSLAGRNVLVTGASGFVGRHLLPYLVKAGANVTCCLRKGNGVIAPELLDKVRIARLDLASGEGLDSALAIGNGKTGAGQDIVIHLAALLFGNGWQAYLQANAGAAFRLAAAIKKRQDAGWQVPERLVLVSSLAAAGPCGQAPGLDETAMPAPVSAYGWSKLMVERILAGALGERLVTLRPPIIYGSGDRGLLPVFRGVARGVAVSPGWRDFPVSVIHADDVARAICLCCSGDASGTYHLNDDPERNQGHEMGAFCQAMATALGQKSLRLIRMPLPVMAVTAALASAWGGLRQWLAPLIPAGRFPNWNLDKFREAREPGWLANAGRISSLGFVPQMDLASGMAEAVAGYRREGLL